jgi:hypothetical protein
MNFLKNLCLLRPGGKKQPDQVCPKAFHSGWLLSVAIRRKKEMHHPENKPPYPRVVVCMPRFDETASRFELSTFCLEALCDRDAWNHLQEHCAKGLDHPIYGRADFVGRVCETANPALCLDPDWEPPRHVNILGWGEKSSHLSHAQVIIAACQSHLNPQFTSG